MNAPLLPFIEETRFGNWFINSYIWKKHVIARALSLLRPLMPANVERYPRILDVGCGFGHSFAQLSEHFKSELIVATDAEPDLLSRAGRAAADCTCKVELHHAYAESMPFADASFDLIFCHQTFHHIVDQQAAMAEFFRVLKPGGVLLFAESTKRYIHSWVIRFFFRHPMEVQKTAEEYVAMIRAAGFELSPERINLPYLWWSREDLGLMETLGFPVPQQREETLVNAVCMKPQ
ncbi:MAG: Methyltransferase type 11 [Rhodocyclales bacterium]|nr:Methyltransferase type 11 [Rhodocyclales bacterium]